MSSNKRITDLTSYKSILPYDSELFGIYQPLLGWKSKRMEKRFAEGLAADKRSVLKKLNGSFIPVVKSTPSGASFEFDISIGYRKATELRKPDSLLLKAISQSLPAFLEKDKDIKWESIINKKNIEGLLSGAVKKGYQMLMAQLKKSEGDLGKANAAVIGASKRSMATIQLMLEKESSLAGELIYYATQKQYKVLENIFYARHSTMANFKSYIHTLASDSPEEAYLSLENLDPQSIDHISSAALSPISVVHLFRQYFYELDSFLGTPVNHVWLSPGATVELVEVHTRRYFTEKSIESVSEVFTKTERTSTVRDELSEAVKDQNNQDIKFGASVNVSYGSVDASSTFDFAQTQQTAREKTHSVMREQTEKLSSEIRKNYKTTFKSIAEFTDVNNTKHTLVNNTNELINYEMRRKMRQVGVQVQDIGTYLCWQSYVDDPGESLGLAKLVHVARSVDSDSIPYPEMIPQLVPFAEEKLITIPFVSAANNADNSCEVYVDGVELSDEELFGDVERIKVDFPQEFICAKPNHRLSAVEIDVQGQPFLITLAGNIDNDGAKARFTLHLKSASFRGQPTVQVKAILHWSPTDEANNIINEENENKIKNFQDREKTEYEKTFMENFRERVNQMSSISPRNSDEMREEERIVVYRKLIHQLLLNGVPMPDDTTRHVVSELINAIFDVDKMLYFVAPEWWRPRLHQSRQQLFPTPPHNNLFGNMAATDGMAMVAAKSFGDAAENVQSVNSGHVLAQNTIGYGGINDTKRDNYYITNESEPARIGSSLGWLMQLDGDNLRNAFLNAPWVKAVIPIRPGKEEAAINWLKGVEGMNGITDDVIYHTQNPNEKDINGNPLNGQKLIDVIHDLGQKINRKYLEGMEAGVYPKASEVSDPALVDADSVVTATPIDRVYEHGFYPLNGSFKANVTGNYEIFDQWIEVLPTDQIVPVPVKYDPLTGRMIQQKHRALEIDHSTRVTIK